MPSTPLAPLFAITRLHASCIFCLSQIFSNRSFCQSFDNALEFTSSLFCKHVNTFCLFSRSALPSTTQSHKVSCLLFAMFTFSLNVYSPFKFEPSSIAVLSTMLSADFSQFVVTTVLPAYETSRGKPRFFPSIYLPHLRCKFRVDFGL